LTPKRHKTSTRKQNDYKKTPQKEKKKILLNKETQNHHKETHNDYKDTQNKIK